MITPKNSLEKDWQCAGETSRSTSEINIYHSMTSYVFTFPTSVETIASYLLIKEPLNEGLSLLKNEKTHFKEL